MELSDGEGAGVTLWSDGVGEGVMLIMGEMVGRYPDYWWEYRRCYKELVAFECPRMEDKLNESVNYRKKQNQNSRQYILTPDWYPCHHPIDSCLSPVGD